MINHVFMIKSRLHLKTIHDLRVKWKWQHWAREMGWEFAELANDHMIGVYVWVRERRKETAWTRLFVHMILKRMYLFFIWSVKLNFREHTHSHYSLGVLNSVKCHKLFSLAPFTTTCMYYTSAKPELCHCFAVQALLCYASGCSFYKKYYWVKISTPAKREIQVLIVVH